MRKTYITKMPDKAGAFLKASQIISQQGGNIVRVNYNKAIDVHTLFIEVSASSESHQKIQKELENCNYLFDSNENQKILIIVLKLQDKPGTVTPVLEILQKYKINISYISAQENGTEYQYFKMGLLIENTTEIKNLIEEISTLCEISILNYEVTDRLLDGTVFYISFANEMRNILKLNQETTNTVLVHANSLMQLLDEQKKSPLKTFDYIRRFAQLVINKKGENFNCAIKSYDFDNQKEFFDPSSEKTSFSNPKLYCLEPPNGSNTYILHIENELLFIDSGFSCYKHEMEKIFVKLFPHFQDIKKTSFITHSDVDHTGLLDCFDANYMSKTCLQNFCLEQKGEKNFREQNPLHEPYCILSKVISNYQSPNLEKCFSVTPHTKNSEFSENIPDLDKKYFSYEGSVFIKNYEFLFFEGKGGHVQGETIILCPKLKLLFTGDIFVNIKGFSAEQKEFNTLAPFLMTGVDQNSQLAKEERDYLKTFFTEYTICPGHGAIVQSNE